MKKLKILGLDPSMSNLGIAWATYSPDSQSLLVDRVETVSPKPETSKQIRQNSKDLDRAKQLYDALEAAVASSDLVCVEIPVGSQSARAMASYGICVGLLASIKKPMIQVTPAEVKAVTGIRNASKTEVIDWVLATHPYLLLATHNGKLSLAKAEHQADAVAAIHAAMNTDLFKALCLIGNQQ